MSPTLGHAVALAYVASAVAVPGSAVEVEIRGRLVPAVVVPTPFYRRAVAEPKVPAAAEPDAAHSTAPQAEAPADEAPPAETTTAEPAPHATVDDPAEWRAEEVPAVELPGAATAPDPTRVEVADVPAAPAPDAREEGES